MTTNLSSHKLRCKLLFGKARYILLTTFLCAQIAFAISLLDYQEKLAILPTPISINSAKLLAMGDNAPIFRYFALMIQNAGDSYGRATPLADYDYQALAKWLILLDMLDSKSHFTPSLAGYYYGATSDPSQAEIIAQYLITHSKNDVENKWWWLAQAVYIAKHRTDNDILALEAAKLLQDTAGRYHHIPIWAKQLAAFIYESQGEKEASLAVMKFIAANEPNLSDHDLNYMEYFIKERLKMFDENNIK